MPAAGSAREGPGGLARSQDDGQPADADEASVGARPAIEPGGRRFGALGLRAAFELGIILVVPALCRLEDDAKLAAEMLYIHRTALRSGHGTRAAGFCQTKPRTKPAAFAAHLSESRYDSKAARPSSAMVQ